MHNLRDAKTGGFLKTHGYGGTPIYRSWKALRQRCSNPNNKKDKNCGGMGG